MAEKKKRSVWRRIGRIMAWLGIILAILLAYLSWEIYRVTTKVSGFQPWEMAVAQYTPKDVIGDLGGMKVRIPRYCAEYVEYDADPGFGEKRKGSRPERNYDSRLRSFGIDARFPEMTCLDNKALREDMHRTELRKDNPWISITITAGELGSTWGAGTADNLAKAVTRTIDRPNKFWLYNYERLAEPVFGLEAYVVTGLHPISGVPAREDEDALKIFIHHAESGIADTYIDCWRGSCQMSFNLMPSRPADRVWVRANFVTSRLAQWRKSKGSESLISSP
jgi:hypothetical protein